MRRFVLLSVILIFVLGACSPGLSDDEEPTQTPIIITPTPRPATNTPEPTATVPSTPTALPTPTQAATATSPPAATATVPAQPTTGASATPAGSSPTATSSDQAGGAISVVQSGFGQVAPGDVVGWGFIIENSDEEMAYEDLSYTVIFTNEAGSVIETIENSSPLIFPGERTGFGSALFVEEGVAVAGMEVRIDEGSPTDVEIVTGFPVEGVNFFGDDFFPRATALVGNPLESMVTDLRISAVTYDADGNINGGGFTFLTAIAPASQSGVDVSIDTGGEVANVEVFASLSYLSDVVEANPATDPIVTQSGYGQDQDDIDVGWAVLIENPNAAEHIRNAEILVWFQDADGRVLDAASSFLSILPAGQTVGYGDDFIFLPEGTSAATMSVLLRPGTLEATTTEGWFTVENATYVSDDFFPEVTGTVSNPFPQDYEDLYVTAIGYDEAGNIIGGGFGYLDFAPANGAAEASVGLTASGVPARVELHPLPSSSSDF